jgi:microsomal dipeptidase-like Zn-dependent dipeptidase
MIAPEALPAIAYALADRGYSESDLGKIIGGSWRRVAEANWH